MSKFDKWTINPIVGFIIGFSPYILSRFMGSPGFWIGASLTFLFLGYIIFRAIQVIRTAKAISKENSE